MTPKTIPLTPAQRGYFEALHAEKALIEARIQSAAQGIALGHAELPFGIKLHLGDDPHLKLLPPEES